MIKYILASASPRRKELLTHLGISYEVIPSSCEEVITQNVPAKVVEELSFQKAQDVAEQIAKNSAETAKECETVTVVIGADTVVAIDGKILGKPKDEESAVRMLRLLSGNTHEVYTGVTLAVLSGPKGERKTETVTFHVCTKVTFARMSEEEIHAYVKTKEPMDKAGAYGIQGQCARFIEAIEGDYFNVVGLPLCRLYQTMKERSLIKESGRTTA